RLQRKAASGVTVEGIPVAGLTEPEIEKIIGKLSEKAFRRPRNAYLDPWTDQVVPEATGVQADINSTLQSVMEAPPGNMVLLDLVELDPEITTRLFEQLTQQESSFYTIYGSGGGRNTNIELAAAAINNYLLFPGELFSFNKAVGPRTVERGYELAPIIVGSSVVPGLGGGICQVSSTLYNAVLQAGLEIVERYPHSLPVGYVLPGRDATVSDYLDFKFRNNQDRVLLIKTACWGGRIEITIFKQTLEE
ncbi:MAG TPA: VanW family protein, partial [Firmicutes bacterium]|nr:VanW family protein [Bacillota bacterium]